MLAAAAERAGWEFECYYGALRRGRHFGGGDPARARPGWPNGSLVAGGRHLEQAAALTRRYDVVAVGDPACVLWPALEAAEALEAEHLYEAVFDRLGQALPRRLLVLESLAAPYLYPELLDDEPALAREASGAAELEERADEVVRPPAAGDYGELTAAVARRHAAWGRGVLLGDPDLVAAQLPRARRLRLLPLYAQPQVDAVERAAEVVRAAEEPVWGRQYDDRDFFALGRLGRGFQLVDPDPPFDALRAAGPAAAAPVEPPEPDDAQLEAWAREGRVLATLLLWSGMVRELDCVPRLVDVVAATGLRAGLVLTVPSLELAGSLLAPLAAPRDRGGVLGRLEPLLASTGRGVCAETLMPEGALAASLAPAREDAARLLPPGLAPRGWWPLLDAPLVPHRSPPVARRGRRPVLVHRSRVLGALAWRARLTRFVEERRPFERVRPGAPDERVSDAVRAAGFSYMWSKAGFGRPRVLRREGDFAVLTLTAGNWDGWSPFYTVGSARDVERAERRLLRGGPGWLVGTIDGPLWALSGEILERGPELLRIAELVAGGGRSGRLVNVTPNVVARYARLLSDRRSSRSP